VMKAIKVWEMFYNVQQNLNQLVVRITAFDFQFQAGWNDDLGAELRDVKAQHTTMLHRAGKGLSTTKDTGSGKCLSTTKAGGPLLHNSFPNPEYRSYPEINGRGLDPRRFGPFMDDDDVPQSNDSFEVIRTDIPPSKEPSIPQSNVHLSNEPELTIFPQSNKPFQTIPTNVPLLNEPSIPQSSIHLSNEPVLTNIPSSNEPMLTNVPLLIEPEPIIGQTKTSEDPYDFSKDFNIGDLYRDRIELKNHIRAYAVVNKFNLEYVLSNEYKIVMRGNFEHAYQLFMSYLAEVRMIDPDFIFDIQTILYDHICHLFMLIWHLPFMVCHFFRYRVAYTNHVKSWNNVILKVRDLPIHVFIEELRRICLEMSYMYREEAEKSQARLTP
ncbi:hypothetical protein GIB67_042721, partial [Kingdonia uniflora]